METIFKKHIFLQKEHPSTHSDAVARKGREEILAKNEIKIFFSIKFFIKRRNQKRDNSNEHHIGITNITFLFAFFLKNILSKISLQICSVIDLSKACKTFQRLSVV